jgi:hypothetical protein
MGTIAAGASKGMDGIDKGLSETLLFLETTQNKVCSDAIDSSQAKGCTSQAKQMRFTECSDNSLDKFLSGGENLISSALDFTEDLALSLTGSVSTSLAKAEVQVTAVNTSVAEMYDLLTQIQADSTTLKAQAQNLKNPQTNEALVSADDIPDVASNLQGATDAQVQMSSSISTISESKADIDKATTGIKDDVSTKVKEVRTTISDALCDIR